MNLDKEISTLIEGNKKLEEERDRLQQELDNKSKPVGERLNDWLKENGITLSVYIQTPKGEHISPDNFIPAGWSAVPVIVEAKQNGANGTN